MVWLFGFGGKRYHEVVAVMLGLDEVFVKSDIGVHKIYFSISLIPLRTSSSIVP
jgi:mRNA-degrading endonuclease HigB of HigAB toxin-antitoxin module